MEVQFLLFIKFLKLNIHDTVITKICNFFHESLHVKLDILLVILMEIYKMLKCWNITICVI